MNKKHQGTTDSAAEKIRADLQALASRFDPKESQAYTFSLMAQVFYDMEAALDAGATQRDVYAVFAANGVPVPFTRFTQNLARLRDLFPARKTPPRVDASTVEAVAGALAVVTTQHEQAAKVAEVQTVAAKVAKISTSRQTPRPAAIRRPRASTGRVPVMERMQMCANALLELAEHQGQDPAEASRRLRLALGNGWTIKTAIQFIIGTQYAEWLAAPWSDPALRDRLARAQAVALRIVGKERALPDLAQLAPLAVRALKAVTKKGE